MRRTQIIGVLLMVMVLVLEACSPQTVTPPPETVTITPPPETITITPPPDTITITPPPETITVTPPPETITVTPPPPTPTPTPTPTPNTGVFEVSRLKIEPSEATVGQTVTITATVTNVGVLGGTFVAELKINDQIVDSQSIYLVGGGGDPMGGPPSTVVEFTFTPSEVGIFTVAIGAQTTTLTVT